MMGYKTFTWVHDDEGFNALIADGWVLDAPIKFVSHEGELHRCAVLWKEAADVPLHVPTKETVSPADRTALDQTVNDLAKIFADEKPDWVDDTVDLTVDAPLQTDTPLRVPTGETVLDAIVDELAADASNDDHPTEQIPVVKDKPAVKTVSGVIIDRKQARMDKLAETVDAYRTATENKVAAIVERGLARMDETDREIRTRVLPQMLVEVSS